MNRFAATVTLAGLFTVPFNVRSQWFEALGPGCSFSTVYDMLAVGDSLFMCGDFAGTGDMLTFSKYVLCWDGANLQPLGCGIFPCDAVPGWGGGVPAAQSLAYWNGELYISGEFHTIGNLGLEFIARFNGTEWVNVGGGMDGPVRSLRAYPDGLYAAGWYRHAGTTPAEGLARWDGTQWHSVHDLPLIGIDEINRINDVAIFSDHIYIGGNFDGVQGENIYSIAQWNGSEWTNVGNGFRGSLAQVLRMEVHDSLLYIAGQFADEGPYGHPLNPASGIVAWDGEDWVELGSGTDGASIPWVIDMAWHNDTLYVCGDFNKIGGVDAGKLAYWDGHRWCGMLPPPWNYVGGGTLAVEFYQGALHLGGSFTWIGTDSLNRVAKWIGGDHVEACGESMGVDESETRPSSFSVFPNPSTCSIEFIVDGSPLRYGSVRFRDTAGRLVLERSVGQGAVDISGLNNGVYRVQALDRRGQQLGSVAVIIAR